MTPMLLNAFGAPCGRDEAVSRIRAYAVAHGVRKAARVFGISVYSVSAMKNSKGDINCKRLMTWFARSMVKCPVLGSVTPQACRMHSDFARRRAAKLVSNPAKARLYLACRNCQQKPGGLHGN